MSSDLIKVLVVEDEESIRKFIAINLVRNGFEVTETGTGEEAVELLQSLEPRVIVLDLMLPGMDGYKVCEMAKKINPEVIIIMLTAKSQDMDKIMGLDLGADDYMVKPFNPLELVARIRAILRRSSIQKHEQNESIKFGDLLIDIKSQKFYKKSKEVELTPTEFSIMKIFMEAPGRAFSRDEILNLIWGENYFGDVKTVDVHIRRIREKIENNSSCPEYIETIWGRGYRFKEKKYEEH